MDHETCQPLTALLKAPSKEVVIKMCNDAFLYRNTSFPADVLESTQKTLEINKVDSKQLLETLVTLVKSAVFQASSEPADIVKLFPDGFHKNLRDLLGKILIERLPEWKQHSLNNMASLPRLVDFDWRVDIKSSSGRQARMSVPTCLLQLQVQDNMNAADKSPGTSTVNVELSKETLDTMLDGLGKIRDQLNSVTNR